MDYDDNDFQNQTFQLVSEENNAKFPPGLRSYSLPKFDLDDNVNSRFDSLVGSEGLLGIQSQEENQWIEDFSGGSSGIEFSSTAAESCSISRRNNVWSEATSSESVEMLLKSVGQDEMIMGQTTTIIEGSVSGDGLGNLATQMGLQNSDKDGSVAPSKGLDAIDMDSALPTNLSKEAADKLQPLVEDVTGEGEASVYGSLKDLGPSSVIETYCSTAVTVSAGDLFVDDDKCRKTNLESVPLVSSEGKNKVLHECPPGFENMHLDSSVAPDPTHAENVSDVSVSNCDSLTANKKNYEGQGDVSALSDSSRSLVVCSSEAAETTSEVDGDALRVETTDSSMEAHVSSPEKIESSQSCERKIGGLEPSDTVIYHSDASLINKEIERSTVYPGSKVECDTDGSLIVREKGCTSPSNQTIVIPERMVDETTSVQVLPEQSDVMKLACDNKLSGANDLPEGSIIDVEPEEDAKAQLLVEKFAHSDKQEAVTTISLNPSSSSVVKVRSQMPDLSISPELREGEPSTDAGKILDAIGKPSSPLGRDSTRWQNKPPTTVANKDALDSSDALETPVSYESLSKINDGAQVVGVSFVEQEGAAMKSAGSYSKILKSPIPSSEGSSHDVDPKSVGEKKDSGNYVQSVLLGEESDALNDSGDFSKSLMMLRDDADRQSMQTGCCNPNSIEFKCGSPTVISCSETSQGEKEDQFLGDSLNGCTDILKPARMLKGDSELHPAQTENSNLNPIESNCGSPTVISCSEPSLNGKENLVLDKEFLEVQPNASVCEANIATSVLVDPKIKCCSQDDKDFTFEVGSQPHPSERTGDGWRPFPTDLPCASEIAQGSPPRKTSCQIDSKMLSHVTQGSFSTETVNQVNSKMSSHIPHGSPRKSGGRKARKGSKGQKPADDTEAAASDKTAGTEAPNDKRSPLKNELLLCQKECQEGKGGIDQGTNQFSSTPLDPRKVDLHKDDRSITFKATSHAHLVETAFPSLQPNDVLQTVETSPIMSSFCQTDPNIIQEISFANTRTSGVKSDHRRSRADSKVRSGSAKVVDRVAAKQGKTLEDVTPRKQIKGRGSSSSGTLSPSSVGVVNHVAPAEEMRQFGFIEGSNTIPSPLTMGHTSSLPDLNTSIPTSALFQQPFTDSQQVQLRAQIFVYGSLIQGTAPDEPCMMSAFGESDGGRSIWENVWRVALERLQHQKSPLSSAKVPAQTTRSFLQSNAFSTPARVGGIGAPSTMISPVPMLSPFWNVSSPCEGFYASSSSSSSSSTMKGGPLMDPHQTLVQVHHPYQSPHLSHHIGSPNTWQSQAPASATWVVSTPQSSSLSAPNAIHSAALPFSETVHVPSGREPSSVSRSSGLVQQPALPPSTPARVGSPTSVSARAPSPMLDVKRTPPSGKQAVVESKARKRGKGSASLEIDHTSSVQATLAPEPVSFHEDGHQLPTTSVNPVTAVPSNVASGQEPSSVSHPSGLVQQPALPPSIPTRVGSPTSVSVRAPSLILDVKKTPSGKQAAVESKPRKRRKGSASLEIDHTSSVQATLAPEPVSFHEDGHQLPTTSVNPVTTVPSNVASGREPSSVSRPSGLVQQPALPPSIPARVGSPTSVSVRVPSPILDVKKTPPSGKQAAVESNPRKRRKGSASLEIDQISSVQPTLAPDPVSFHGGGHQLPTSSVIPITAVPSNFDPNVSAGSSSVIATSPTPPRPNFQVLAGHADTEQRGGIVLSEETCRQIDQAQRQAEEASSLATIAVKHSQSVWTQLAIQRSSGLVSDVEAKLASAAVAIAAAAAVAKAAAAATRIASDAAMQAKLMADEVLVLPCTLGNITSDACLHGGVKNMGNFVSPTSILKGKDRTNNSDSILVAAREAAKKRVEAASAATRRAKNLDAVVKAAGMAAEAVSQALTIIAMGDPVPFTLQELVEAGPENYWKVQHHMFSDQSDKSNSNMAQQPEVVCAEEGVTRCIEHHLKETEGTPDQGKKILPPKELSKQVENNNLLVKSMCWGPAGDGEKRLVEPKPGKSSDFAETIGSAPQSQIGSICALQNAPSDGAAQEPAQTSIDNQIEEGSVVEVFSCEEGLGQRLWLPAKVLNLKDGKAYVCYTELARDKGSGQSTEWVPLDGEGGQAPRIRIPHLGSAFNYEGTRKRHRAARGDYCWAIGDMVDAWINNGWWEGTITGKGKDDDTNLTVQLSAQGDASVVGSWNLRPSLIWRDGHWMEWSRLTENIVSSHEGDTPPEKRTKLGPRVAETDVAIEVRETDKIAKHKVLTEISEKPETSGPLLLSAKEIVFNIGKNSKEDNRDKFGKERTGLQKQGSSVGPGVPKPGKKRKMMDVSKQYAPNRGVTTTNESNNSINFAKLLIPQDSGPRGWKNPSKVVSWGKRVAESRPTFHKSGNPDTVVRRNISERDGQSSSVSVPSATTVGVAHNLTPNTQASITKNDGNMSGCVSDAPSLKKKTPTVAATSVYKRKHAATPGQRFSRKEEKDRIGHNEKSVIPDAVEPRRSVRRIQPTSRLLEGIQSSLIISKIPNARDRGTKGQHRGAAASKGNNG